MKQNAHIDEKAPYRRPGSRRLWGRVRRFRISIRRNRSTRARTGEDTFSAPIGGAMSLGGSGIAYSPVGIRAASEHQPSQRRVLNESGDCELLIGFARIRGS